MKIDHEVAQSEFDRWVTAKKISKNKRESLIECEKEIVEAIEEGCLMLDDENRLIMDLKFPLGGESPVNKLAFAFRVNVGVLNAATRGLKSNDAESRVNATISALTGQNTGIIRALDSTDHSLASCIAVYFF